MFQNARLFEHLDVAQNLRFAARRADPEGPALEMEAVLVSLENLMTFSFVRDAVENGDLSIHGLWTDIGPGGLMQYDANSGSFQPV